MERMNKEFKYGRQFVKCCNLSMYHKSIRIRKKNANRICKLLDKLPDPLMSNYNYWV